MTGVGRPQQVPRTFSFAVAQSIRTQNTIRLTEAEVFYTGRRQLYIGNSTVFVILLQLLVIFARHAVKIQVFSINDRLTVRRDGSPIGIFNIFLLICQMSQLTCRIIVGKVKDLLLCFAVLIRTIFLRILRRGDLEGKSTSVLFCFQLPNRQLLGGIRIFYDLCQFGRQFILIK